MEFDNVLRRHVGEFGRWQRLLAGVLGLYGLCNVLSDMDTVFTAARPESWCSVSQPPTSGLTRDQWLNLTVPWEWHQGGWRRDPCRVYTRNISHVTANSDQRPTPYITAWLGYQGYVKPNTSTEQCREYAYDQSTYDSTIVTEWDLVCDDSYLVSVTKSVAMAGLVTGSGVGGFAADRFGRRRAVVITIPLGVISKFALTLAPNLILYNVFNFICVSTSAVCYLVIFTLSIELVGPSWRVVVGALLCEAYAAGYLLLALLGYLIRSWRTLEAVCTVITAVSMAIIFVVPESPRWLLARGDTDEARRVLRRLAKLNGRSFPDCLALTNEKRPVRREKLWHLVSSATLFLQSLCIFVAWFTAAATYYGLTLMMGSWAGPVPVNMAVSGCLELLAYLLSQALSSSCLGRRLTTSGLYIIAGLALLLTLVVPPGASLLAAVLTAMGRFCVCCVYNCLYVWTAELLPTGLRSSGLSTYWCLGKVGAVIVPFTEQWADVHPMIPVAILGTAPLLCGFLLLLLPETRGKPLPETVDDVTTRFGSSRANQTEVSEALNHEEQVHCDI